VKVWEQVLTLEAFVDLQGQAALDGSGDGTVAIGPVPTGRVWMVERIACNSSGATAGDFLVYRNDQKRRNLLDGTPTTATRWTFLEWPPIKLTEGETLLIVGDALTASGSMFVNIQGRQAVLSSRCVDR